MESGSVSSLDSREASTSTINGATVNSPLYIVLNGASTVACKSVQEPTGSASMMSGRPEPMSPLAP